MDHVRDLLCPAAAPPATETLDVSVLGGLLVERREDGENQELKLFGRLDGESAPLVRDSLPRHPLASALVDLTQLDSLESGALRSLTDHQQEAHRDGRELLLRIAPHQVAQLTDPEGS